MNWFAGAPWPLVAIAGGGILAGGLTLLWVLGRIAGRLRGRKQPPVGVMRYFATLSFAALCLGAGLGALGLVVALREYQVFTRKTPVAEVQCIELGPGKLRLFYVPIDGAGQRGETRTYDVDGDQWTVSGDVLRFRPYLTILGLETVHKVTRVEGRWLRAADANARLPTAHDLGGGTGSTWLTLYRDGTRGPLGYLVAGVHGQAVSQLPDRRAAFDIYVTPNGYIVDKRSL